MYIEFPDLDFQLVIAIYFWEKKIDLVYLWKRFAPHCNYIDKIMAPTLTTVSVFKHSELFKYTFKPWADCKKKNFNSKRNNCSFKVKSTLCKSFSFDGDCTVCAFETHISQNQRESSSTETSLNPLSANRNKKQFSPNNIHTLSRGMVMRINKMITKGKMPWSFIKFSQVILKKIYGDQFGEFVCGYCGLKG